MINNMYAPGLDIAEALFYLGKIGQGYGLVSAVNGLHRSVIMMLTGQAVGDQG
ncbi:MAG TPA: hypothetical protein PL124_09715 [Candidatus Cloacimonadota bacterium]|nr:hypothetical protein [Candidatus Cloacimonadota bacterium]